MANRATTDTCCLTLPLIVEKWQSDRLEKRFEIARQIYNTLLRYELKKLNLLEQSEAYTSVQNQIREYMEKHPQYTKTPPELKQLFQTRDKLRKDIGLTEYGFKTDIKNFYKHFNDNIGSHVATHGITPQVWAAFNRLFYGDGKAVHFKKRGEIRSLRGYSQKNKSGGTEIVFRGEYVEWKGIKLKIKYDPSNTYESEMLNYRVKYCRILRKMGKRKIRWYLQLMLEGKPVEKIDKRTGRPKHQIGKGTVGIDIGPQTIAYVAQSEAVLMELADDVKNIDREKRLVQRKMDRSRRATNPECYRPDGTFVKGKRAKNKSKRYLKLQQQYRFMQHQHAETRKRQHTELANHLLSLGDRFFVEHMEWPKLTKRAKNTETSEKTGRYKRKKRFGKSVGNKAPAMLISILKQKLKSRGFDSEIEVPTSLRASQYNHLSGEYQKKTLGQRWNDMPDGRRIQRDLYSAFLLQHVNDTRDGFDNQTLRKDYESFVELHDNMIKKLQEMPKTVASMGIKRTAS